MDMDSVPTLVEVYDNADESRMAGAEIDIRYFPTESLQLLGGIGILNTSLEVFEFSAEDLSGNVFQRAPNLSGVLGIAFQPLEKLRISAQGRYVRSYFSDDLNTSEDKIDPYFVADAQVAYLVPLGQLYLYTTNIFNTFYEISTFRGSDPATAIVGPPPRLGIGFDASF